MNLRDGTRSGVDRTNMGRFLLHDSAFGLFADAARSGREHSAPLSGGMRRISRIGNCASRRDARGRRASITCAFDQREVRARRRSAGGIARGVGFDAGVEAAWPAGQHRRGAKDVGEERKLNGH
jgi:hypothetical protein